MPSPDRLDAGLRILGVYFLVQAFVQGLLTMLTLLSAWVEPYGGLPLWKLAGSGFGYALCAALAAFLCLRKTAWVRRLCGVDRG